MTEPRRPQSRMIPVAVAGLIGVLLGALIVVLGVLAGRSACCCNGPACGPVPSAAPPAAVVDPLRGLGHQTYPPLPPPVWLIPRFDEGSHPVPLPGSLMLVAVGGLAWALRG